MIFYFKRILVILFIFLTSANLYAEIPHFLDFKFVLNESNAGKKAQTELKNRLDKGIKNIKEKEKKLQEEEKKLSVKKKYLNLKSIRKKLMN